MKAILFAVLLCVVLPFAAHAESSPVDPETPVISQETSKINLNKADVNVLTQSFKGIGRKRAEAIISYRETNGPFKSIDDLALVKGIGKTFVEHHLQQLQATYSVE